MASKIGLTTVPIGQSLKMGCYEDEDSSDHSHDYGYGWDESESDNNEMGFYVPIVQQDRHWQYHRASDPSCAEEEAQCHQCQLYQYAQDDADREINPMTMCNFTNDGAWLPEDFKFIKESVLGDGVHLADAEFQTGCDCRSDWDCAREGCHCLQDVDDESAEVRRNSNTMGYISSYYAAGERKGCLRDEILEQSRDPIYECHDKCNCSPNCPNRVVGNGADVSLHIFRTNDGRGWGLKASKSIKKGQFVGSYIGEIITHEEAERRRDVAKDDIYLFALDKFSDPDSPDPRLAGEPYEVDGQFKSGPTRFINHSCDPNLRIFAVVADHANKPFHQLCFFALDDIDKGDELTFDYTDGVSGNEDKDESSRRNKKFDTVCKCGAEECRGSIW